MRIPHLRFALTLAALSALVAPATASAGTAFTQTTKIEDRYGLGTAVSLSYRAGRGEANRLRIEVDASGATLTDRARIRPGRGCLRVPESGRRQVRCEFRDVESLGGGSPDYDTMFVGVRLGDRPDVGVVSGDFPAGAPSGVRLEGGPGSDRLRSSADSTSFIGGSGNDRMTGGPGIDTFFEGRRRSGADTMRGGSNPLVFPAGGDRVDYSGRRRRIVADLAGDRDDGSRGERDRIGTDVESLRAGGGSDRLTGSAAANVLEGGGGRFDVIAGGRGRDLLDTDARAGVVRSRDGENDSISCRTRRTRALADGYDEVFPRCALRRGGRVGLLVHAVFTFFEVRDQFVIRGRPPLLGLRLGVTCPADARPGAPAGRRRSHARRDGVRRSDAREGRRPRAVARRGRPRAHPRRGRGARDAAARHARRAPAALPAHADRPVARARPIRFVRGDAARPRAEPPATPPSAASTPKFVV